jgi:hypothetical protein
VLSQIERMSERMAMARSVPAEQYMNVSLMLCHFSQRARSPKKVVLPWLREIMVEVRSPLRAWAAIWR